MSLKNLSAKTKIPKVFKNKLHNKKISQIYKKFAKSLNIISWEDACMINPNIIKKEYADT